VSAIPILSLFGTSILPTAVIDCFGIRGCVPVQDVPPGVGGE